MKISKSAVGEISKIYGILMAENGYPRPDKLEAIFVFWLTSLNVLLEFNDVPRHKYLNLHLWYLNSQGLDLRKKDGHIKINFKRKIIHYLFFLKFFNKSILPGGQSSNPSMLERVLSIFLISTLSRIENKCDNYLRDFFLSSVNDLVDKDISKLLSNSIPDFFFSNIILSSALPTQYTGSMSIAHDEPFNKIFFQSPAPHIIGYVHGGFYGEYLENRFEELEKALSDEYYGWGLEYRNQQQNRFRIHPPTDRHIKHLVLLGTAPVSKLYESYFSGIEVITSDANEYMKCIADVNQEITYFIHPSEIDKNYNGVFRRNCLSADWHDSILEESLHLFDRPGQTYLYKCIYESLPFVLIYSKNWLPLFKPKFVKFLELLHEHNLLYWHHDKKNFLSNVIMANKVTTFDKNKFTILRNFLEAD
jgi:hypothetical protein